MTDIMDVHVENGGMSLSKKNGKLHISHQFCSVIMETIYDL